MSTSRMIARAALVVAAITATSVGVAATAGVTLPVKANSHAVSAHATSHGKSDAVHPASSPSPNAHAAYGQCVAANAKTASTNHAAGWSPTVGCAKANAAAKDATVTGLANAQTHASSHASAGLQKAATASANSQSHSH